jgi:hypothetical protein
MTASADFVRILLLVVLSARAAAVAADCGANASLASLIADAGQYHGKAVRVVAHVTIEFENMTVCPSANETQMAQCLWLAIDDGPYRSEADYGRYQAKLQIWKRFHRRTVVVDARFDKTLKGHFSMWPAGLGRVKAVSGSPGAWDFSADPARPRRRCDELP